MGNWFGIRSKSTVEVLNDLCTKVTADSILTCTHVASEKELVEINNVTGNVNLSHIDLQQAVSVDIDCTMKATKQSEIADKVAEAIVQTAEAKGQAFLSLFGNTRSEAVSNLTNKIKNTISAKTSEELKARITQEQTVHVHNVEGNVVVTDVNMRQGATQVAKALMKTTTFSKVINDSASKIDQKSATEDKNPIAEIIKSIFQAPVLLLGGIVLGIVLLIILFKFGFSSSGKTQIITPTKNV
jgi:hypothetical protein